LPDQVEARRPRHEALSGTGHAASSRSAGQGSKVSLTYSDSNSTVTAAANAISGFLTCPTGSYAVGGGISDSASSGVYVADSYPYNSQAKGFQQADSWLVYLSNTTSTAAKVTSYVVCASGVTAAGAASPTAHLITGHPKAPKA